MRQRVAVVDEDRVVAGQPRPTLDGRDDRFEGADAGGVATMAKYAAGEAAVKALDQAIQTHGGNGLAHEYGLSELWFITRLMRTAPVSREMVLNYVAQTSLGLPRSY